MKGITEIELTDVKTGKVEKYKETNLVTNAMADFFSHNINGMLFTIEGNTNDLNGNMLPLCKNAIGGILLFSDTIEENPIRLGLHNLSGKRHDLLCCADPQMGRRRIYG